MKAFFLAKLKREYFLKKNQLFLQKPFCLQKKGKKIAKYFTLFFNNFEIYAHNNY